MVARHQHAEGMSHMTFALAGTATILPHVRALRSRGYAAQGQTEEVLAELKQSLDGDPDGSYHFQIYQSFKKLGDEPAAAAASQKSESVRKRGNMRGGGFLKATP